jgi:hypothetical protein
MSCITTPTVKTSRAICKPQRRPRRSATGAPMRAPKKVPTLRIDVVRDVLDVESAQPVVSGLLGMPPFTPSDW